VLQLIAQIPWSHFIYSKTWMISKTTRMILKTVSFLNKNNSIITYSIGTFLDTITRRCVNTTLPILNGTQPDNFNIKVKHCYAVKNFK